MLTAHLLQAAQSFLAAPPTPTGAINTTGVVGWLVKNIVPILVAVVGVAIVARANRGQVSKVVTSTGITFLGLAMIAGAATFYFVGDSLVKTIFN